MNTEQKGNLENVVESVVKRALQPVWKVLTGLVESNQQMIRGFVIVSIFLVLSILFLEYFRRWWKDDFELHFPVAGAAIVLHSSANASDFRSAVFMVPASKCWVNTGLEVKNGERISIRASGQIHLAMNQIEQEKIPRIPWSEPNGSPFVILDSIDRSGLLIYKQRSSEKDKLMIGNLVGYFLPVDDAKNIDVFPSAERPRPTNKYGNVFHIGTELPDKLNDTGKTVHLWLTINDIVLDSSARGKEAYLGNHHTFVANAIKQGKMKDSINENELADENIKAEKLWISRQKEWSEIRSQKVWDLYYYDNIGHYLVTVVKQ
jgi:hypothetical protein